MKSDWTRVILGLVGCRWLCRVASRPGAGTFFVLMALWAGPYVRGSDTTPTNQWVLPADDTASSPAVGTDGTIYLGTSLGFFAFKGTSPLAKSCWPKFRGDAAQTGRLNADLANAASVGH